MYASIKEDDSYPDAQHILNWSILNKGEGDLTTSKGWHDLTRIPEETRYSLMSFLMARKWSIACDILTEHPSLAEPWASNFLRNLVFGEQLSTKDFEMFCTHIFVLDLAQTWGIERTCAFLKQID